MPVVFTCNGVELQEFGGETFSTLVRDATLTIRRGAGSVSLDVAGNTVDWVPNAPHGPFKRIDTRTYMIATTDLMSSHYLTLPKGLPDARYEYFNAVLTALKEERAIPAEPWAIAPEPAAGAALAGAVAPAPAGEASTAADSAKPTKSQQTNPFGDLVSAIAQKAAHDTLALGDMIKQKAAHDMKAVQDGRFKSA